MKIRVEETTYDYDPNALTLQEAFKLKEQIGVGYTELVQGSLDDPRTWVAIVWLCRYRDGEYQLRVTDVDAKFADIEIIPDDAPAVDENPSEATLDETVPGSPNIASE